MLICINVSYMGFFVTENPDGTHVTWGFNQNDIALVQK